MDHNGTKILARTPRVALQETTTGYFFLNFPLTLIFFVLALRAAFALQMPSCASGFVHFADSGVVFDNGVSGMGDDGILHSCQQRTDVPSRKAYAHA
jgi:hypothetical protein